MNRRGFLGMLGAAIAGATLDPERLLWKPGAKLVSIPKASHGLTVGDVITFYGVFEGPSRTGLPMALRKFVICGEVESSHPMIFPPIIPAGQYQNVITSGWDSTMRPPASKAKRASIYGS